MKLIKLTAITLLFFGSFSILNSCETDAEMKKILQFSKNGIVLSGAQESPVTGSAAIGKIDVAYDRETRLLTYTVSWSGLSGAVTAVHINGLAPVGYAAPTTIQTIANSTITKCSATSNTSCGSFTGTLLMDGVVVKEADLLNGMYYLHLHTAAFPATTPLDGRGEIRAQIVFQ